METTTNTRSYPNLSTNECKAMALMQHLGNDYFIFDGSLFAGTEAEAHKMHEEMINSGKIDYCPFENWLQDYSHCPIVDTDYGNVTDVGYEVFAAQEIKDMQYLGDIEFLKGDVFSDAQLINDTLYLIFQRPFKL